MIRGGLNTIPLTISEHFSCFELAWVENYLTNIKHCHRMPHATHTAAGGGCINAIIKHCLYAANRKPKYASAS